MITYRLTFHDDHLGAAKYVEFEGRSPADALPHLANERPGRRAELSRSGNYIATLRRTATTEGLWIVDRPDDPVSRRASETESRSV